VARIRAKFPEVKIMVGRWGRSEEFPDDADQPKVTGADGVDETLAETQRRLAGWHPVLAAGSEAEGAAGKRELVGTTGASS